MSTNLVFLAPILVTLPLRVNALVGIKQAPSSLALVAGIGAFVSIFGNPFFGRISDRTTSRLGMRRPWMVIGLIGGTLGVAIVSFAPNIPVVLLGWCIAQLCFNALLASIVAVLPDQVPTAQRGTVSGVLGVCLPIAAVSGTYLVKLFTGQQVASFLAPCAAGGFFILLFAVFLKDRRLAQAARPDWPAEGLRLHRVDRLRSGAVRDRDRNQLQWFPRRHGDQRTRIRDVRGCRSRARRRRPAGPETERQGSRRLQHRRRSSLFDRAGHRAGHPGDRRWKLRRAVCRCRGLRHRRGGRHPVGEGGPLSSTRYRRGAGRRHLRRQPVTSFGSTYICGLTAITSSTGLMAAPPISTTASTANTTPSASVVAGGCLVHSYSGGAARAGMVLSSGRRHRETPSPPAANGARAPSCETRAARSRSVRTQVLNGGCAKSSLRRPTRRASVA